MPKTWKETRPAFCIEVIVRFLEEAHSRKMVSERSYEITKKLLKEDIKYSELAEQYGVTKQRIEQIFKKTITSIENFVIEGLSLREKNVLLNGRIIFLEHQFKATEEDLLLLEAKIKSLRGNMKCYTVGSLSGKEIISDTPIFYLSISEEAKKLIQSFGIKTIGELTGYSVDQLCYRNSEHKKLIEEIREMLAQNNLYLCRDERYYGKFLEKKLHISLVKKRKGGN